MTVYDLKLDATDLYQILDALESRAIAYENTADSLNGEPQEDFFIPEECDDAGEAIEIARHFRDVIAILNNQMDQRRSSTVV